MKLFLRTVAACFILSLVSYAAYSQDAPAPSSLDPVIVSDSTAVDGTRFVSVKPSPRVCSKQIDIEVSKKGVIRNVAFTKGCPGNTFAVCELIKGMKVKDAVKKLEGTPCGKRGTSCPDQLASALKLIQKKGK